MNQSSRAESTPVQHIKARTMSTTSIQSQQSQQQQQQPMPSISNIMCRTIPCSLSNLNADSLDWSSTGFLSFGCQNIVVICHFAHGKHLLQLQTLHRHKSPVNRTAWPEIVNDWAPARSVNLKASKNENNNPNSPDSNQRTNTFSDQINNPIDSSMDDSGLIRLASSDVYGTIVIWNMLDAAVLAQISTPPECLSKTIVDMKWISCSRRPKSSSSSFVSSNNHNYLLVLYSSSVLALYETELGDLIWLKNLSDQEARCFAIDPFDSTRLLMSRRPSRQQSTNQTTNTTSSQNRMSFSSSPDSTFYLVDNIDCNKPPTGPSLDFALRRSTTNRKESISSSGLTRQATRSLDRVGGFFLNVTSYNSSGHPDDSNISNRRYPSHTTDEYIYSFPVVGQQCSFNPAVRNQVIVLVNRELVVIDLEFEIVLYIINIERNIADISCFYPCRQRNLLITLHESGSIAARLLQKEELDLMPETSTQTDETTIALSQQQFESKTRQQANNNNNSLFKSNSKHVSYSYNSICQTEILRQTRQGKICGFKVSPVDETRIALLMSNGKIIVHQLSLITRNDWNHKVTPDLSNHLSQRTTAIHPSRLFDTLPFLNELIDVNDYYNNQVRDKRKYQLLMTQMLSFLDSQPTAIRMGPPATVRNWRFHKPFLAIGNIGGSIQIFNLSTGYLYRELGVHACSVRGIEWVCLNAFISYAYTDPSPQTGEISWELCVTDIETGKTVQLKAGRNSESSIIQSVKVSHLRQYFIIVFRGEPFEIWDLENLSLLRLVSKKFTGIVAAEWSPLYTKKIEEPSTTAHAQSPVDDHSKKKSDSSATSVESANTSASHRKSMPAAPIRENFVVTNKMGELFHFSIAGSVVKEMSRIPPETTMTGVATAVAWKSDHVVLGDGDGNISVWDLKQRESRTEATMRGSIRKIRFAPGRGNMKILLLFDDGVDIWDIRSLRRLTNIKSPRDHLFKVCDIDWAGSDRPVILTSDGLIIVTDLEFKQFSSPLKKLHLSELVDKNDYLFNYHLLHPGDRYVFRTMHYHNNLNEGNFNYSPPSSSLGDQKQQSLSNIVDNFPSTSLVATHHEGKDDDVINNKKTRLAINTNLLLNASNTSKLLADYESHSFWQMVSFMLNRRSRQNMVDHGLLGDSTSLDTMFDLFLDCDSFIQIQRERASLLDQRKNTHGHSIRLYELLIVLGQKKQAANILLETEPTSQKECQQYLLDSFRACLTETLRISSSNCDGAFPMIKLVATNLIAAGNLHEGCQLLNLIDRNSDACHYLISASQWYAAVKLAKLRLIDTRTLIKDNSNNKDEITRRTKHEKHDGNNIETRASQSPRSSSFLLANDVANVAASFGSYHRNNKNDDDKSESYIVTKTTNQTSTHQRDLIVLSPLPLQQETARHITTDGESADAFEVDDANQTTDNNLQDRSSWDGETKKKKQEQANNNNNCDSSIYVSSTNELSDSGREVIAKWCDHLISNNQISIALLALLSLEEFVKVIDLLVCIGDIERAAILTRICLEQTLNTTNSKNLDSTLTTAPANHHPNQNQNQNQKHHQPQQQHNIALDCGSPALSSSTNATATTTTTITANDVITSTQTFLSRKDKNIDTINDASKIDNSCIAMINLGLNEQYDDSSNKIDDRIRLDVLNSDVAYKAVQRYYCTLKDFNMTALQDDYRQLLQLFNSTTTSTNI